MSKAYRCQVIDFGSDEVNRIIPFKQIPAFVNWQNHWTMECLAFVIWLPPTNPPHITFLLIKHDSMYIFKR